MNTCFETKIAGFDITVKQSGRDNFTVVYGKQVAERLTYVQAAHELGECMFHALACEGKLDNKMKNRR